MDGKKIGQAVATILSGMTISETEPLETYLESSNAQKLVITAEHPEFGWTDYQANKNGTYSPSIVRGMIEAIKVCYLAESETDF